MNDSSEKATVTIKKYANRRLYNTATSSYVTLENLSAMIKEGTQFNVYDAKTGEDLTRSVLTQIIVEEESKSGQNLLPISFLRQLIGFYGDNMQWMVPKYLEQSMQWLTKNQDQMRGYVQNTLGNVNLNPVSKMFPFGTTLEEMSKQNLAIFEKAMTLFSPFTAPQLQEFMKTMTAAANTSTPPSATTNTAKTTATPSAQTTTNTNTSSTCCSTKPTENHSCCSTSTKNSADTNSCCSTKTAENTSCCATKAATPVVTPVATAPVVQPVAAPQTQAPKSDIPSPADLASYRATTAAPTATKIPSSDTAEEMQQKISSLQKQLAELAKRRG